MLKELVQLWTDDQSSEVWPLNDIIGYCFLPLTPWLSHPAVKARLQRLGLEDAARSENQYALALRRYVYEINRAIAARLDPNQRYMPPWENPLSSMTSWWVFEKDIDERIKQNFVYSWKSTESQYDLLESANARLWATIIIEMHRFITDSNLAKLFQSAATP